jgi:hypothetical protein
MNRTVLTATRALLAATAVALVVAGCGGNKTPSKTSGGSQSGKSTKTTPKKPKSKAPGY